VAQLRVVAVVVVVVVVRMVVGTGRDAALRFFEEPGMFIMSSVQTESIIKEIQRLALASPFLFHIIWM
jgi:hypothetical protein